MTIVRRPSVGASMLGGSIHATPNPCRHAPARAVHPWAGEDGTAGTVAVVGAGKMGLPLAAQFATHGWRVIAVDVNPEVVATINAGRSHVGDEPGLADLVAQVHGQGRLRATLDAASAAREADVVVLIVPVMLDAEQRPDYAHMDAAVASIAPGVHAGSTVIFETTLRSATRGGASPRRWRRRRAWSRSATSLLPSRPNGSSPARSWRISRSTRSWSAGSARRRPTARRASTRACWTRRSSR